jgi:hypothetical protein
MPDASTLTVSSPPADRRAVHIVLFGMPAAGKSSLLGALAQAAQTQEHLLSGRLTDPSHGLSELQHRLYEEEPRRTVEEVVPYTVDFEPFSADGPAVRAHLPAVLIDCDGRVANDLLVRRQALPENSPEGTLASEVLAADALVLVVDAAAPPAQVDADFGEFGRFLRLLERSRGQRSEVGGLPVFLVLTKCDLLAQPGDGPADWMERITQRQRQVEARFHEFLASKQGADGPLPFGRIELHLGATAVKRPALAGSAARPREPYGVAELFRQCLEAARGFRERRRRSARLLVWTVAGTGAVVAGLVGLTVLLLAGGGPREHRPGDLESQVENFRAAEGRTAAERLQGELSRIRDRMAELNALQSDPGFGALSADEQEYVKDRLEELRSYAAYYRKLQSARRPVDARSEEDLQKIEDALKTKGGDGLALPRDDWAGTRAARLREDRLQDVHAVRSALDSVEEWLQRAQSEGEKLWTLADFQPGPMASINWQKWHTEVRRYLSTVEKPPFPEAERLPEATSPDLTYETVYRFGRVEEGRAELARIKKQLGELRDLTAALGLGGQPSRALLVISPQLTAADAGQRLQELRKSFPDFDRTFPEIKLPDAARGDVRQAAEASYRQLLDAGRAVVLRHLQEASPNGPETVKLWQAIRPWLADPTELNPWRVLARVLGRLADPERQDTDPVAELHAFLGRDHFDIELRRLTLEIPDAVRLRPDGDLKVVHQSADGKDTVLKFTASDKQRDAAHGLTTYTLRPADGKTLLYRPGEELYAQLPVRDAEGSERVLTWAISRSQVYQFERLVRQPRLHLPDQSNLKGQLQPGVRLAVAPGQGAIPRLPDLVPVVRFDKSR